MPIFNHDQTTTDILAKTLRNVPREPDPLMSARSLARGTTIVGLMLENLSDKYVRTKKPGSILVRVSQVLWSIVELAAPRSLGQILFQYWIVIGYALAIGMVVIGLVSNRQPVTQTGYLVLALCIIVNTFVEKLRRWMATSELRHVQVLWCLVPLILSLIGGAIATDHWRAVETQIGWGSFFIVCYSMASLSFGWLIATHFDRSFRLFALILAGTAAMAILDFIQKLQTVWTRFKDPALLPVDFHVLQLSFATFTIVLLLSAAITAWIESRSFQRMRWSSGGSRREDSSTLS